MDILEIINLPGRNYDVREHESKRAIASSNRSLDSINNAEYSNNDDDDDGDGDYGENLSSRSRSLDNVDILAPDEISNRLKLHEREKEIPLLPNNKQYFYGKTQREPFRVNTIEKKYSTSNKDDTVRNNVATSSPSKIATASPILTRANYFDYQNQRAQSPMFISSRQHSTGTEDDSNNDVGCSSYSITGQPAKSVLKKSTSFSRIDTTEEEEEEEEEDENEVQIYQKQLQRELQTRRSLLSVRFAE